MTTLASEFSLILPPPGTPLISYFPKRDDPASLIPIKPTQYDATNILSKNLPPIYFSGVPQAYTNNPLLVPILHAPAESFAAEVDGGSADALVDSAEKGGEGLWAGSSLGVVTGFQSTSGGRVTWLGGVDVLSDELANKEVQKYALSAIHFFSLTAFAGVSSLEMPNSRKTSLLGLSKKTSFFVLIRSNTTASTRRNLSSSTLTMISLCAYSLSLHVTLAHYF